MAKLEFIMQGLSKDKSHYSSLVNLLKTENATKLILSTAFLRTGGIRLIKDYIVQHANNLEFYVGIRNDITSAQALKELIEIGINPYVIDTGSSDLIFHPKVYLAINDSNKTAVSIIGSANLTTRGLAGNIEASILADLDFKNNSYDFELLNNIVNNFEQLKSKFPNNVIKLNTIMEVDQLLTDNRVVDENLKTYISKIEDLDHELIENNNEQLLTPKIPKIKLQVPEISFKKNKNVITDIPDSFDELTPIENLEGTNTKWILKWESTPLKERDLNIPQGYNTNPTGSMTLRSGASKILNFQSYFRHDLFSDLNWQPNLRANATHLEIAHANFEVIILGIRKGVFNLEIKHDPRKNTRSYEQKNAMSHLKWGNIATIIRDKKLLGCTLKIYENPTGIPSPFVIAID